MLCPRGEPPRWKWGKCSEKNSQVAPKNYGPIQITSPIADAKLALITPYRFYPPTSGGQHAVFNYLRSLAREVDTLSIGVKEDDLPEGIRHVAAFGEGAAKYLDPRVGWRIRRILRKEEVTVLGLQHHYHALLLWPFVLGLGLRIVIFSHNLEYRRWRTIGKWWWPGMYVTEWGAYRWADRVFFISRDEAAAAPNVFGLSSGKCIWAPFPIAALPAPGAGTPIAPASSPKKELGVSEGEDKRMAILARHGWRTEDKIILFFGPQSYAPNLQAVLDIVFRIHPELRASAGFDYRIAICGGGLPERYGGFADLAKEGVHYLGFVPKIEPYLAAADVVLTPVNTGGGVKIKLIEAVANGKTVVSSRTGAGGVDQGAYGEKLVVVEDEDWAGYARALVAVCTTPERPTPASFYAQHGGERVAKHILAAIADI